MDRHARTSDTTVLVKSREKTEPNSAIVAGGRRGKDDIGSVVYTHVQTEMNHKAAKLFPGML
jgi:hypothetical protein